MVKVLQQFNGQDLLVDDDIYEWAKAWTWYLTSKGYPFTRIGDELVVLHHVVLLVESGRDIHHEDGNKLNCTRDNLRSLTKSHHRLLGGPQQNNASGYRGVYYLSDRGRFQARLHYKGRNYSCGYHATAAEASAAVEAKRRELLELASRE